MRHEELRPDLRPWAPALGRVGRVAVAAVVVVNILNAYAIIAGPTEGERYWFLMDGGESNPNTWLSVVLLSGAGLLAGACWVVDGQRRTFWALVAAGLFAMSFDDAATVHERVGGNVDSALGSSEDLSNLWVVPWAVIAFAVAVVLWRQRPQLPRATRRGLWAGAGVVVGAAVGFEVLASETVNKAGTDTSKLLLYTVEENLELIGALIIARTLTRHAIAVGEGSAVAEAGSEADRRAVAGDA